MTHPGTGNIDVVILGAGASGLACARCLVGRGLRVIVLEARDRVGGRIHTLRLPGQRPFEFGAQLVHGERACTLAVIREAGLTTTRLPKGSELLVSVENRVRRTDDLTHAGLSLPWEAEAALIREDGSPDRPVTESLRAVGFLGRSRAIALDWLSQTWGGDVAKLSSSGIRRVKSAWQSGAEDSLVVDGYDLVPAHLARGLDIRLSSPAQIVRWGANFVEAVCNGSRVRARKAVITIPPSVVAAGGIAFDPPLPDAKLEAAHAIQTGDAIVMAAQLRGPARQSAWALVVGQGGAILRTEAGSALVSAWFKGPSAAAVRQKPPLEVMTALVTSLFPWARSLGIDGVYCYDWGADPYSRGAHTYPAVGCLDRPAAWASPIQRTLFFAGEATCGDLHPAMVHGAIESGQRAADEITSTW